jgi:glutathione synthase/RimK-type ligase-like ATP-grasp enzyme
MKLILANNQSKKFVEFYKNLQDGQKLYDYSGYKSLLFYFDTGTTYFINLASGRKDTDYSGVYITSYHLALDQAITVATILDAHTVNYIDKELKNAPSLSKLSEYAKLAQAGVTIPRSFGGSAYALMRGIKEGHIKIPMPVVLKRADADRGADNFKLLAYDEVIEKLTGYDEKSLWILQEFIPNDGFYRVGVYGNQVEFTIFRSLQARPDGREELAHMFKPRGGSNATLVEANDVPQSLADLSLRAAQAMNRQIAGVDCIYDQESDTTYVLEVNYNPQLVTIETFKEVRQKAFLDMLNQLGE